MLKFLKTVALLFVLLSAAAAMAITAAASAGFTVSPVLPENQRAGVNGYFDLIVTPGQKQELVITVANSGDQEIAVVVEAVTASTNRNGIVNYSSSGIKDETMQYSISDLMKLSEENVVVPPQSQKDVVISLTVPDKEFDGLLLGSVRVLKEATEAEKSAGGAIVNQYAYVIALKLSENDRKIEPDFALGNVSAELVHDRASIVAELRNIKPLLAKEAVVTAKIYAKGSGEAIFEVTKDAVEFAPNTVFPFTLLDEAGYGLSAGIYLAEISVEYDGQRWDFEREFEIKAEEAENINKSAVNQQPVTAGIMNGALPVWALIAIGAGGILLIVIIVLMVLKSAKSRKEYKQLMQQVLELQQKQSRQDQDPSKYD